MTRAAITGVAGYVPDYVLSNAELEKMVDTNDAWIRERTGISERRLLKGEGLGTSDLAVPAVLRECVSVHLFLHAMLACRNPLLSARTVSAD